MTTDNLLLVLGYSSVFLLCIFIGLIFYDFLLIERRYR